MPLALKRFFQKHLTWLTLQRLSGRLKRNQLFQVFI